MALTRTWLAAVAFGLTAVGAGGASAQQPEPTEPVLGPYRRPTFTDEPAAVTGRGRAALDRRYRHDGLYVRFAGGVCGGYDYIELKGGGFQQPDGKAVTADVTGACGATELAVGGTPLPGLVLGAGLYTTIWPAPGAAIYDVDATYEFSASQLVLVAPFADWYVFPRSGLHGQLGFGFADYVMGQGTPQNVPPGAVPLALPHTALGFGLMLGVGWDWFVGEQWSLGILGRMTRAWTHATGIGGVDYSHDTPSYAVLLSLTYH